MSLLPSRVLALGALTTCLALAALIAHGRWKELVYILLLAVLILLVSFRHNQIRNLFIQQSLVMAAAGGIVWANRSLYEANALFDIILLATMLTTCYRFFLCMKSLRAPTPMPD